MVMRDYLGVYEETGMVEDINTGDNPFTDQREPAIIGQGYFRLEPLSYLIDNPVQIELIGTNYENHGKLDVNIVPVDENGNEEIPDEDVPDQPEDLLNRRIDYLVQISQAKDLPSNFCKDVFVEYQIYLEEEKYRTEVVPGKNRDPEFKYQKHHTQSVVTENFLKYIKDECLTFKVFGFPDVKKQPDASAQAREAAKKKLQNKASANAAIMGQ